MKYPKVLQVLAIATAFSVAVPGAVILTQASETTETPQEYVERTGYILPEGYHYVLDGQYIILDNDGMPLLEADSEQEVPEEPETPAEPATPDTPAEPGAPDTPEIPAEPGNSPESGETGGSSSTGEAKDPTDDGNDGDKDETGEAGETGDETDNENKDDKDGPEEAEGKIDEEDNAGETGDKNQGAGFGSNESEAGNNAVQPVTPETPAAPGESAPDQAQASVKRGKEQETAEPFYLTSSQFRSLRDRIQYNVEVPIEGLPAFITQEMVVGALKTQDETGYPASVTIAQIIQESGYGKYGPGGEDGEGLSYLAFEYCNLFGIKGAGTAGSVSMKTSEMESDGSTYSTYAGFRAYNTYTECIEDRSELLAEVYSDLTENVTDANTFAMRVGKRWATDLQYGKHLINAMRRYDLYRLDDMTLNDFDEMIGEFANPCPGSTITSLFGKRNAPIAGASTYHKGLDMGTGAYNIPTYAAKAGTVVFAGDAGACGNLITIDHGDGLVTKYMHHAEIYVKEGDTVEKGQQIGLSGTTGNSTGNHLHFQVEADGKAVDPLEYLQASAQEAETAKEAYSVKQAKAVADAKEASILRMKEMMREKTNY